jgi:FtsP/CotA-like multicopper oxidase with cupredoxin domain
VAALAQVGADRSSGALVGDDSTGASAGSAWAGSLNADAGHDLDELGAVVIALPGEVTRLKLRFHIRGRYVWHCHVIDHEDNEMMRPFRVT